MRVNQGKNEIWLLFKDRPINKYVGQQVLPRVSLILLFMGVQWNLGYTSKSGLKNSDVELRAT